MGNCLVTKLKGVVDNENLLKIDEFFMTLKDKSKTGHLSLYVDASKGNINIVGDGYIVVGGQNVKSVSGVSGVDYQCTSGDYRIKVNSKYDYLTTLNILSNPAHDDYNIILDNVEDLKYMKHLSTLRNNYYSLPLTFYNTLTGLTVLALYFSGSYGSLSDITISGLRNLILRACPAVIGSIADAAGKTALIELDLRDTQVNGSVESFASAQVSNGRTSGTISINCLGSSVTYNSRLLSSCNVTYSTSATGGYTVSDVVYAE